MLDGPFVLIGCPDEVEDGLSQLNRLLELLIQIVAESQLTKLSGTKGRSHMATTRLFRLVESSTVFCSVQAVINDALMKYTAITTGEI